MKNLAALRALESLPKVPAPVVTGFDGFVDEMISVVAERTSLDHFSQVPDIATFGGMISAAAGHSSLREIVVNAVHPGGCAVNLGDGLAALGVPVDCFATLGEPMHPAFSEPASRFRKAISWGREPGRTLAFEFSDGKLMFSSVKQLEEFTPQDISLRLGGGVYQSSCLEAAIIALTDWSLYPHMTAVWRLLQHDVYSKLTHRPHFFIDLVDPSSRSAADILAMVDTLPFLETCGPVTLGLNGNEANILAQLLGLEPAQEEEDSMRLAAGLRTKSGVSTIVIHNLKFAASAGSGGGFSTQGPFCERPLKSTGAGDRFNAGYCLGLLAVAAPEVCLSLGCAASGFFVRNAHSPSRSELAEFMKQWAAGTV
ncbi:MAG: carbohydrate kinase [Verrucomicrobia bacterium]|nr:carbohydrate kinase [Verrucomicrobiota bacterium]